MKIPLSRRLILGAGLALGLIASGFAVSAAASSPVRPAIAVVDRANSELPADVVQALSDSPFAGPFTGTQAASGGSDPIFLATTSDDHLCIVRRVASEGSVEATCGERQRLTSSGVYLISGDAPNQVGVFALPDGYSLVSPAGAANESNVATIRGTVPAQVLLQNKAGETLTIEVGSTE